VERIVYLKCNQEVINDSSCEMEIFHRRSQISLPIFLYWMVFSVMLTHISISIVHIYKCILSQLGPINADLLFFCSFKGIRDRQENNLSRHVAGRNRKMKG
jgi:hypothetical protein